MAYWRRLLGLAALGFAVVVALDRLSGLEPENPHSREAEAVFTPLKVTKLADDTLVDALIELPLADQLIRAGWDHEILTVDLALSPSAAHPQSWWQDASTMVELAFGRLSNVRQLLLRLYREDGGKRTLLVTADTRRSDWTDGQLGALEPNAGTGFPAWAPKLRLSWTADGKRWIENITIE